MKPRRIYRPLQPMCLAPICTPQPTRRRIVIALIKVRTGVPIVTVHIRDAHFILRAIRVCTAVLSANCNGAADAAAV